MGVPPTNPPYIFDADPDGSETGVARDKVLTWSILDPDGDLQWWKIWIDEGEGENLVYDSTEETPEFQAPYDGPSSDITVLVGHDPDDGVAVTVEKTSDWPSLGDVTVHVIARDWMEMELDTSWTFTIEEYETEDTTPPYVQNQDPAPDATGVAADAQVSHEVIDDEGNLAPLTVQIWINDTVAWAHGAPLAGFVGTTEEVTNGERFILQPVDAFEPGTQTVRSTGEDTEGNAYDETWSFQTVPQQVTLEDATGENVSDQDPPIGIDLKLDTSWDVYVEDYDLVLVAGVDEVAQHLGVGLKLFLGEWYLDEDAGIPYYRHIFIAAPNSRVIEGLFRQDILGDADIEAITEFEMEIDRARRHLDLDFTAKSKVGEVNVSAVFP